MRILLAVMLMVMYAMPASAEIYKWRDKDGTMRYSDMPPPANVKQEKMTGKKVQKTSNSAPLSPVTGSTAAANAKVPAPTAAGDKPPVVDKAAEAKKRAEDAEKKKKEDEQKAAELKQKEDNCKAAKTNQKSYATGGRMMKTNENGDREYLSDAQIQEGRTQAAEEVSKYCD